MLHVLYYITSNNNTNLEIHATVVLIVLSVAIDFNLKRKHITFLEG